MKEDGVIYQIRTLEKMICRKFFKQEELQNIPQLTATQMQIMGYILKHMNEEIYQKELEEVLNLSRATVSGVLQTMEKNNLIERIVDTEDTRTKKIILNENAKKIFFEKEKKKKKLEKILVKNISEEELKIFSNVIKKMKENMKENEII